MNDHPVTDEENEMYWRVLGNQWPNVSCDMVAKILKKDDEIRAQRKAGLELPYRAAEVQTHAKLPQAVPVRIEYLPMDLELAACQLESGATVYQPGFASRLREYIDLVRAYATSKGKA
jgi:hypothetical protein